MSTFLSVSTTSTPIAIPTDPRIQVRTDFNTQGVSGKGSAASRMLPGDQHECHWGDDRSSPRFTPLDDHEVLDDDDEFCTRDACQVLEAAATEDLRVDAANVDVLLSEAPEEPSDEPKHIRATSPPPSPSMHSLFSGSPSFATSQSEVIPHIKSRATSPHLVEPVASTSRVPTHNVEAWKALSFMTAPKGEGKAVEQRSRPYERHKRRRTSPTPLSPLASHKRQKISADGMTELAPARPADDDERLPSTVSNGKRNHAVKSVIRESHRESPSIGKSSSSAVSNDISQIKDVSLS